MLVDMHLCDNVDKSSCGTNRIREDPVAGSSDEAHEATEVSQNAQNAPQNETASSSPSLFRDLVNLFVKIVVIALILTLTFTFLYGFCRVSDPDMFPRVSDGDLVLFYRLSKDYSPGDLLLLNFKGERQVRRVIATAGDTVDITEDGLVINGSLQQESTICFETLRYEDGIDFPVTLQEGEVFVLGDNRTSATDSRIYGPVNVDDTLGTVITVIRRRSL